MKSFFIHYKNPLTVLIVLAIMGGLYVYSKLPMAFFRRSLFRRSRSLQMRACSR
jgi:hypothetical protein